VLAAPQLAPPPLDWQGAPSTLRGTAKVGSGLLAGWRRVLFAPCRVAPPVPTCPLHWWFATDLLLCRDSRCCVVAPAGSTAGRWLRGPWHRRPAVAHARAFAHTPDDAPPVDARFHKLFFEPSSPTC
jgi:hypothetical protein